MERELREEMTPEARDAWQILLAFIVRKLQQGYYGQARIEELDRVNGDIPYTASTFADR